MTTVKPYHIAGEMHTWLCSDHCEKRDLHTAIFWSLGDAATAATRHLWEAHGLRDAHKPSDAEAADLGRPCALGDCVCKDGHTGFGQTVPCESPGLSRLGVPRGFDLLRGCESDGDLSHIDGGLDESVDVVQVDELDVRGGGRVFTRAETLKLAQDALCGPASVETCASTPEAQNAAQGGCGCRSCLEGRGERVWMMVTCSKCGNKRCPHTENHRNECTGSNDVDQGHVYTSLFSSDHAEIIAALRADIAKFFEDNRKTRRG